MAAHGPRTVAAVLVAAGSGERLAAGRPKAFVEIAGRTLLEHAVDRFAHCTEIVVVAPADLVTDAQARTGVRTVPGGATRQQSVAAGLAALGPVTVDGFDGDLDANPDDGSDERLDLVLVHDVARPFVTREVIDRVVAALVAGADAVVPVVPIADTVRRVTADGALAGVVDRSTLVGVQTPQGFRRAVLFDAHARPGDLVATDDAGLVEAIGGRVIAVLGADENFKITTRADLTRAASLAALA